MRLPTLILFCKRPKLGFGKQRLAKDIGKAKAFEVSELLLSSALQDFKNWQGDKVISPSSTDDVLWAESITIDNNITNCITIAQGDGAMGQRILELESTLRENYNRDYIMIMGSDCTPMKGSHFLQMVDILKTKDFAITPALDGGATLMGSKITWPNLDAIAWSTEFFAQDLIDSCGTNTVGLTDSSYDIDCLGDLIRFAKESNLFGAKRELQIYIERNFVTSSESINVSNLI